LYGIVGIVINDDWFGDVGCVAGFVQRCELDVD